MMSLEILMWLSGCLKRYWKPLLALFVVALCCLAVWQYGENKYADGYAKATDKARSEQAAAIHKQATAAHAASADYQAAKAANEQKEKVRYVEIEKIVKRDVYRNVCLDADGVSIINDAIAAGR